VYSKSLSLIFRRPLAIPLRIGSSLLFRLAFLRGTIAANIWGGHFLFGAGAARLSNWQFSPAILNIPAKALLPNSGAGCGGGGHKRNFTWQCT
jgi:hypothetical protein